jgi:glyoxylase-like metal-dependent hydrolase (beta-lactamase superfamily II)
MKIADNLFIVPGVTANCYLISDLDGLTVVDAGLPGSHKKILAYVASLGKSAQQIKRIVITHADLDHYGALAALKQATGARTFASQIEAQAMANGKSSREIQTSGFSLRRGFFALIRPFLHATPFQVDQVLAEGQTLPALGGLRVLETPGHTPGHLSLFAPVAGVLFCGDSMVADRTGLRGSRPAVTWDADQARLSERKQAALGAQIVCSGHGPVVRDAAGKFPTDDGRTG